MARKCEQNHRPQGQTRKATEEHHQSCNEASEELSAQEEVNSGSGESSGPHSERPAREDLVKPGFTVWLEPFEPRSNVRRAGYLGAAMKLYHELGAEGEEGWAVGTQTSC